MKLCSLFVTPLAAAKDAKVVKPHSPIGVIRTKDGQSSQKDGFGLLIAFSRDQKLPKVAESHPDVRMLGAEDLPLMARLRL